MRLLVEEMLCFRNRICGDRPDRAERSCVVPGAVCLVRGHSRAQSSCVPSLQGASGD